MGCQWQKPKWNFNRNASVSRKEGRRQRHRAFGWLIWLLFATGSSWTTSGADQEGWPSCAHLEWRYASTCSEPLTSFFHSRSMISCVPLPFSEVQCDGSSQCPFPLEPREALWIAILPSFWLTFSLFLFLSNFNKHWLTILGQPKNFNLHPTPGNRTSFSQYLFSILRKESDRPDLYHILTHGSIAAAKAMGYYYWPYLCHVPEVKGKEMLSEKGKWESFLDRRQKILLTILF